ncbi:MAG: hypothetical protein KIT80_11735 [Chitinophagaceae bacterium]|nr:hypothetical protein [Chitinophagaceae bacterium]MCW5927573.1 hypothetical protein [Chitinophagaceae bacterium]
MQLLKNKSGLLAILSLAFAFSVKAQDEATRTMLVDISYHMPANRVPYLKVTAKEKVGRNFIPLKDIIGKVYINEEAESSLLEDIRTDSKGESRIFIPAAFKTVWDASGSHQFIVVTEAGEEFESVQSEVEVTKAKIEIDTVYENGVRNIIVKVSEQQSGEWQPAGDVEVKIAIQRLLGNLPVGEEDIYTTDEEGTVSVEFTRDSLPGDEEGNYVIVAWTEDHEQFGNVFAEKTVNWGVAQEPQDFSSRRSLWATGTQAPVWLLGLAFSIIGGVWGTLIYLFIQIVQIRKLGKTAD